MCFSTSASVRSFLILILMSAAFASTCALVGGGLIYARVVADTVGPGTTRLLLLAPALCVNVAAPLLVLDPEAEPLWTAIAVANFAWWTNFKLIALAAGRGQLTGPALSAPTFLALAALPVKFADERDAQKTRPRGDESPASLTQIHLKKKRHSQPHTARDAGVGFACKLACLSACVCVVLPALDANSSTSKPLTLCRNATYAVALYAFLGALFDLGAALASAAFGAPLARHFDLPFLATSFGDFWGARWNLVAGASLRDAVYAPITEGRFFSIEKPSSTNRKGLSDSPPRAERGRSGTRRDARRKSRESGAERKSADAPTPTTSRRVVGVFACFAVSGAMHEFVFWALEGRSSRLGTSRAIGWEWFAFFFAQAPLVSLEAAYAARLRARREKTPEDARRKPPTLATVFFVRAAKNGAFLAAQLALANALFFPPVARNSLDARIVADVRKTLGLGFVPTRP